MKWLVQLSENRFTKSWTGDAKDSKGIVTGKHGGIEHVLVDFQPETLEKIILGDMILVKAFGLGLKLIDYADVKVMNMDPVFWRL